jgi:hypothetical protein
MQFGNKIYAPIVRIISLHLSNDVPGMPTSGVEKQRQCIA